jgi:hypothetical protein
VVYVLSTSNAQKATALAKNDAFSIRIIALGPKPDAQVQPLLPGVRNGAGGLAI